MLALKNPNGIWPSPQIYGAKRHSAFGNRPNDLISNLTQIPDRQPELLDQLR